MKQLLIDVEVDLWEACNLRCAQCTHCAPLFTDNDEQYTYENLSRDLDDLGKVAHIDVLRVVGGEPLLNKNLLAFLRLIRSKNICNKLTLFTNGLLLGSVDKGIFEVIDRLRISVYNLSDGALKTIEENVKMVQREFPQLDVMPNRISFFNKVHTIDKNKDPELLQRIYKECYYSYKHNGLSIFNGRLYRCYVARKIYKYLKANEAMVKDDFEYLKTNTHDSIGLAELTEDSLQTFLEQKGPLESCKWCLGSSGTVFEQRQLRPTEIDTATTKDVDFEGGRRYLSNLLLSWCIQKKEKDIVKDNDYFHPEYIKDYAKQFKTKCF